MLRSDTHSEVIKRLSKSFGFDYCGISKAEFLEDHAKNMEQWLKQGYHGEMGYLENHFDKRLDPTLLVEGAKTVVSLMYNYYPSQTQNSESHQIAKYAYGQDYHVVVKEKCQALLEAIRQEVGAVEGRVFVDSAPVLERAWAEKSGIGWIGKHGLLINKTSGSFFFLAELIIDLECTPDGPIKDYCGTCTKCVDACPTDAILPNKTLNAAKCISYLTIELKSEIPSEFEDSMNNWMFGCDICQDVCPWNRFSTPTKEPRFQASDEILHFKNEDWENLQQEQFNKIFKLSAVKRTKFSGLKRNIHYLNKKK
jgi:epoxyqueuosine reductase